MKTTFAIAVLLASISVNILPASAQAQVRAGSDVYAIPGENYPVQTGRSSWQRENRYDRSGTAGRLGLGADPRYPEGPGNPSSPR